MAQCKFQSLLLSIAQLAISLGTSQRNMSIIQSIQIFVTINFLVIGLSHFSQPKIWIEFFDFLYKKGNVGNIFNAMLALGMGSIILSFHFVWTWPMFIITLYGLTQIIKGLIYLTFPSVGLKSIRRINDKTQKLKWVGLGMCIFSIALIIKLINDGVFEQ